MDPGILCGLVIYMAILHSLTIVKPRTHERPPDHWTLAKLYYYVQKRKFGIEKLSLRNLELEIRTLYDSTSENEREEKSKIQLYLQHRKDLINNDFRFNIEIVSHIERVNQMLTNKTARLLKKTTELARQMQFVEAASDDFLDDYEIEAILKVEYNGKDLLHIEFDENIGRSDYHAMADILYSVDYLPHLPHLRSFSFSLGNHKRQNAEELYSDEMLKLNWNIEELSAPELKHIKYFSWASHLLLCDSLYSTLGIVRIETFWAEINVKWQNFG